MPDIETETLQSTINYIFLPPQLPQSAPESDEEREINLLLCDLTIDSISSYRGLLPLDMHPPWYRLKKMLDNLRQAARMPLAKDDLKSIFINMDPGDVHAMHIRAQNAAVVSRKQDDGVTFEIFEASPLAHAVMGTEGKLICSYPGPAIKVPAVVSHHPAFLEELANFLVQMDVGPLNSSAETRKAGSNVREVRETANPRYISELLVGILRGAGEAADVPRIAKRIADDVVWASALKPWRRSPLWLIIRVVMQTSLPLAEYKRFMVFHHARVLSVSLGRNIPSDLLFVMRAKTARRLYKLPLSGTEVVASKVKDVAEATEKELQGRWTAVQRAHEKPAVWEPETLDLEADTAITLPNSRPYLTRAMNPGGQSSTRMLFTPNHTPRRCMTADFHTLTNGVLDSAVAADPHLALADFEESVQDHVDDWVEKNIRQSSGASTLQSCFDQYVARARPLYKDNEEDTSIMLLTLMELWVGLDKLAVAQHPLLLEYSPEIPRGFIERLLLRRSRSLERSIIVEKYVRKRWADSVSYPHPSIFSDAWSWSSLSAKFFQQSQALQRLKADIERTADRERNEKRTELLKLNGEYSALQTEANRTSHTYKPDYYGCLQHTSHCERCNLDQRLRTKATIEVHEWPLPSNPAMAANVVFEWQCPSVFSIWRDVTYAILRDVGLSQTSGTSQPEVVLGSYSELRRLAPPSSLSRITIGSTTKSWKSSHYKRPEIPAVDTAVLLPHALQYRLWDKNTHRWAADASSNSSITHLCKPTIPSKSPYDYLEYAIAGTSHIHNEVLASQSDCPKALSLHEHIAFGSLRSGPLVQWLNIIREYCSNVLTFSREEVHTLISHAAAQTGPLSGAEEGHEWHEELNNAQFGRTLLSTLEASLDTIKANWLQAVSARSIIFLASRLLASASDAGVRDATFALLRRARCITFQWTKELKVKLEESSDDRHVDDYQRRLCDVAAACCATYDVDAEHLSAMLRTPDDLDMLVQCSDSVYSNMPPGLTSASAELRKVLSRHHRTLRALEDRFAKLAQRESEGLDKAVVSIWPSYRADACGWGLLTAPNSRWLFCSTVAGDHVHYNILEGRLLINGQPVSRLPRAYVEHPTYARIFGQKVLDVVPSSSPGMLFAARSLLSGSLVSFSMRDNILIIRASVESRNLELIPHTIFNGDFPTDFVQDFAHWLDLDTGDIEFRPLASIWDSQPQPRNWVLRFRNTPTSSFMEHGTSSTRLVDIHSETSRMIADCLGPLESRTFLNITFTAATPTALSVDLPRFRLKFTLNSNLDLELQNLPNMTVDPRQSSGSMIGLRSQLVLRAKDAVDYGCKPRLVLIPDGDITITPRPEQHHPEIHIKPSGRRVSYHKYWIDEDLGIFSSDGSLTSKLFKAYLHAITSHCLPDPLTGRTGTEEALHELQSAGSLSFQRLDGSATRVLREISELTPNRSFYPAHLTSMQTVEWTDSLSPLSQHHDFHPSVQRILDHAARLEIFYGDAVEFNGVLRDASLLRRAARRNSILYPAIATGRSSAPNSNSVYQGQDCSEDLHKEHAVFMISQLTQLDSIYNAHSSVALRREINSWRSVGRKLPFDNMFSLSYSPVWMTIDIRSHWIDIFNMCRQNHPTEIDPAGRHGRFKAMFSLSAMAYGSPDLKDMITVFVGSIVNPEMQSVNPPSWPFYQLSEGTTPQRGSVLETIMATKKDVSDTPAGKLPRRYEEDESSFNQRRYASYKSSIDSEAQNFGDDAMACFWNHQDSSMITLRTTTFETFSPWFSVSESLPKIEEYFRSCGRNSRFVEHVQCVERVLHARPARDQPGGSHYQFQPRSQLRSGVPTPRVPNLDDLLSSRKAFIPTPSSKFPRHVTPLGALLSELGDPNNLLHRRYAQDLDESRIELQRQGSAIAHGALPAPEDLFSVQMQCKDIVKETLEAIQITLFPSESNQHEQVLLLAGLWPRLTPHAILSMLAFPRRKTLSSRWEENLTSYAQVFIGYQRSRRLTRLALDRKQEDFFKEACNESFNREDALRFPDWLLIQIEADFLVRPIQADVAREMIAPSCQENMVLQLNMGEGKSSVIVPLIASTLSDGTKLVRVVVLKALANQMFRLAFERLCGLANRRIFYLPFQRGVSTTSSNIQLIHTLYEECMHEGGVLIAQPEHILSYKLIGIDHSLSTNTEVAGALQKSQEWLRDHSRDILDESDEILHNRYQLVYTMGEQRPVEDHPDRWRTTQELFSVIRRKAIDLHREHTGSEHALEFQSGASDGSFPYLRLLDDSVGRELATNVIDDVLGGALSTLSFALLTPTARDIIRGFILTGAHGTDCLDMVRESSLRSGIFLLRGMLAHDSGILLYVLRQRRWRVDYGLDPSRSLLAVPYRAKDVPSMRAEFGHPDVAIALTCLSYYYGGLTTTQLRQCFEILSKLDNPALEYNAWVQRGERVPLDVQQLSGVNTSDHKQFEDVLYPTFSRNQAVIDFFLSQVVFPREAKEFPYKLTTSGWDLAERRANFTTGFSGTNDNRYLLPTSISQRDPVGQLSTNALVLGYLLQPENDHYICTQSSSNSPPTAAKVLDILVKQEPEIRVLLDVGAQMLDLRNEGLAKLWLSMNDTVSAAVFFNDTDDLVVVTRDGIVEPFTASPFRYQLDKCLVYLDDAHTRGTDLKLPLHTRAAVTLGRKVTKDRLLQGCMRMRQLGHGQSVMFCAPLEVDRSIRAASPVELTKISVLDILRWVMLETCTDIEHHIPQWASQGLDYNRRHGASTEYASTGDIEELRRGWLQPEARTLSEMYGPENSHSSSAYQEIRKIPELFERMDELGVTSVSDARKDEEQEREVSHEVEREQQIERPPKVPAATHRIHPDVQAFVSTGILPLKSQQFISLFHPLQAINSRDHPGCWSRALFATLDFARTVKSDQHRVTEFLRPVNWILSCFREGVLTLVALSPFEVNGLLAEIRQSQAVQLHIYTPRVAQSMLSFSDLRFYSIPARDGPPPVPSLIQSQLNLWSGQLYLDNYETYAELCAFLGVELESADGAGQQRESDGFVRPENRAAGGRIRALSSFTESPLPALRELVGLRRKGMTYLATHVGQILHSRRLTPEDLAT